MKLYRCFDVEEDTPIQFVGVYTTRWKPEWGEPTVMFREAQEDESLAFARQLDEVQALVKAVGVIVSELEAGAAPYKIDAALRLVKNQVSFDPGVLLPLVLAYKPFKETTDE